jgi:hypothetical protein
VALIRRDADPGSARRRPDVLRSQKFGDGLSALMMRAIQNRRSRFICNAAIATFVRSR